MTWIPHGAPIMLVSLLLSALTLPILAAWSPLPLPGGGEVTNLVTLGDTLVVCATGGCAKTADAGESWIHKPATLAHPLLKARPAMSHRIGIVLDQTQEEIVATRDGGQTWTSWNEGVPAGVLPIGWSVRNDTAIISTARLNPSSTSTIILRDSCQFLRRIDGEAAWKAVGSVWIGNCDDISFGKDGRIFRLEEVDLPSGTTGMVAESRDGGLTWSHLFKSWELAFTPGGVFVSNDEDDSARVSLDSGATWKVILEEVEPLTLVDHAYLPLNGSEFRDLRTGTSRPIVLDSVYRFRSWARIRDQLFVVADEGLMLSQDSGLTWKRIDARFPFATARQLSWKPGSLVSLVSGGYYDRVVEATTEASGWTTRSYYVDLGRMHDCPRGRYVLGERGAQLETDTGWTYFSTFGEPYRVACSDTRMIGLAEDFSSAYILTWPGERWTDSFSVKTGLSLSFEDIGLRNDRIHLAAYDAGDGFSSPRASIQTLEGTPPALRVVSYLPEPATRLVPSAVGLWAMTRSRLYLCTDSCRVAGPSDTTGGWKWTNLSSKGPFVFAMGAPSTGTRTLDHTKSRLFASADHGTTWKTFEVPAVPLDAAATPDGLVLATQGGGLWLDTDPVFRASPLAVTRSPVPAAAPSLRLRGARLEILARGTSVDVDLLDLRGATLLRTQVPIQDGAGELLVPTGTGMFLARVRSATGTTTRLLNPRTLGPRP